MLDENNLGIDFVPNFVTPKFFVVNVLYIIYCNIINMILFAFFFFSFLKFIINIFLQGLQSEEKLKPIHWDKYDKADEQAKMEEILEDAKIVFRRCRLHYISAMIDIYKKQKNVETRIDDLMKSQNRRCTNEVSYIYSIFFVEIIFYFSFIVRFI